MKAAILISHTHSYTLYSDWDRRTTKFLARASIIIRSLHGFWNNFERHLPPSKGELIKVHTHTHTHTHRVTSFMGSGGM